MSNAALESNQHTEKSSDNTNNRGSAEAASSAYDRSAQSDVRGAGSNTADQHLSQANITKDAIEFGPNADKASGLPKLNDSINAPPNENGSLPKLHDSMDAPPKENGGNDATASGKIGTHPSRSGAGPESSSVGTGVGGENSVPKSKDSMEAPPDRDQSQPKLKDNMTAPPNENGTIPKFFGDDKASGKDTPKPEIGTGAAGSNKAPEDLGPRQDSNQIRSDSNRAQDANATQAHKAADSNNAEFHKTPPDYSKETGGAKPGTADDAKPPTPASEGSKPSPASDDHKTPPERGPQPSNTPDAPETAHKTPPPDSTDQVAMGAAPSAKDSSENREQTHYGPDEKGNQVYWHKDENGKLTDESITHPDGSGEAKEYGKDTHKDMKWDDKGNWHSKTFDNNTNELKESENRTPNGESSKWNRDADNNENFTRKDKDGKVLEESKIRPDSSGYIKQYGDGQSRDELSWDKDGNYHTEKYDQHGALIEKSDEMPTAKQDAEEERSPQRM